MDHINVIHDRLYILRDYCIEKNGSNYVFYDFYEHYKDNNLTAVEAITLFSNIIEWIKDEEVKKYAVGSEKYEEAKNALN